MLLSPLPLSGGGRGGGDRGEGGGGVGGEGGMEGGVRSKVVAASNDWTVATPPDAELRAVAMVDVLLARAVWTAVLTVVTRAAACVGLLVSMMTSIRTEPLLMTTVTSEASTPTSAAKAAASVLTAFAL